MQMGIYVMKVIKYVYIIIFFLLEIKFVFCDIYILLYFDENLIF